LVDTNDTSLKKRLDSSDASFIKVRIKLYIHVLCSVPIVV
jgi:hypothetical protein